MTYRLRAALCALVVATGAGVALGATTAADAATPRPKVSLTLPAHSTVSATGKTTYQWRARSAHTGSRVVLQVKQGHTWLTLARSATHHGTFAGAFTVMGPGEPGKFSFRTILLRGKTIDASSGPRTGYAFGRIPLSALCNGVLDNDCEGDTTTLPNGKPFHYAMLTGINEPGDPFDAEFGAASTSCRSLNLQYISDSPDHTNTYVELRQPGQKAQKHTSSSSGLSTFAVTLTGGKFGMSVEQDASQTFMYFAGSGYCYTEDGKA